MSDTQTVRGVRGTGGGGGSRCQGSNITSCISRSGNPPPPPPITGVAKESVWFQFVYRRAQTFKKTQKTCTTLSLEDDGCHRTCVYRDRPSLPLNQHSAAPPSLSLSNGRFLKMFEEETRKKHGDRKKTVGIVPSCHTHHSQNACSESPLW